MTMDTATAERYRQVEGLAHDILLCLVAEVAKLGFSEPPSLRPAAAADYRLERDPSNGEYSLVGEWRDVRGHKQGTLLFHADGTFYVEQDIVRNHPRKQHWFVEAVHAWGKGGEIRAEPRLLALPE